LPVSASPTLADCLAAGLFLLIALVVYGWQVSRIVRDGGKVLVDELGLPELLMSFVFAGFFTMMALAAVQRHSHEDTKVNIDAVLPNSMLFIMFVIGIAGFMRFRGLKLRRTFGLTRVGPFSIVGWAVGLLLAAFPFAIAASAITALLSHGQLEPQPLVDLFNKMAKQHDYSAMSKILISAVVIQPACEEFLFRGFFYAVWKRYIGPVSAGFLACTLFAAFHTSLAAFAGLFVLAVCLNIAYERTGSLFVPICMHALFNLTSLLVLYGQAQMTPAQ
jgi:membrane protease YdiL (CAAX protease family)